MTRSFLKKNIIGSCYKILQLYAINKSLLTATEKRQFNETWLHTKKNMFHIHEALLNTLQNSGNYYVPPTLISRVYLCISYF
jgi:hypothetical protein